MIKAVIFDLDNTLYNYDLAHAAAWKALADYAAENLGLTEERFLALHRQANEVLKRHTGGSCGAMHSRLLRSQLMLEALGLPLRHARRMEDAYWLTFYGAMRPFPGAAECLAELKAAGLRLGVGTNMTAAQQLEKLERLGLLDQVDFLVSSEEADAEKPDSRLFACCVEKARCQASECAFVGDNLDGDVRGALRAGLMGVWLHSPPSSEDVPQAADLRGLSRIIRQANDPDRKEMTP